MQNKRIQVVDALRGFALAGIVLVHMVENYLGNLPPEGAMEGSNQGIVDGVVEGFMLLFVRGKFFALFAFLFGLSFFIQMDKARQKGINLSSRFLWRLILLLLIGATHHLFYRGDILTIYAMLGILLIPFYKVNRKWILVISGLLFLGLGRYVIFAFFGDASLFSDVKMEPKSPEIIAYFNTIKNGSITEVFLTNTTEGHLNKLDFQLGIFGRGYLTFGFFLLGLLAGRMQIFQQYETYKKKLRSALLWSGIMFLVAIMLMAFLFAVVSNYGADEVRFDSWMAMFALTAYDLSNVVMTFILILVFLLLFMKWKGARLLIKFAPYGRMALTNYFLQTLIGTSILYGWGLGYIGELRNIYAFLAGVGIIAVQMLWSSWWLKQYRYGPLEWLWRSLTYFKKYPFKY